MKQKADEAEEAEEGNGGEKTKGGPEGGFDGKWELSAEDVEQRERDLKHGEEKERGDGEGLNGTVTEADCQGKAGGEGLKEVIYYRYPAQFPE